MNEAQLTCDACGAPFGLVQLSPEATCPYCGHRQQIAPELLQRMAAYRRQVDHRLSQIAEQQQHVAAADRFMSHYAARGGFAGAYLAVVGAPLLLGAAYLTLHESALLPQGAVVPAAYAAVLTLLSILVARFAFGVRAADTELLQLGEVAVACPDCGGPGTLAVGGAVAVCSYCGGQLVAGAIAVERGIDAAAAARRAAELQRFRKEREVMVHINRPPAALARMVPALAVLVIAGIVFAAFQDSTDAGILALSIATLLVAIGAAFVARTTLRARARRRAYRDLAQQLHGRVDHGVPAFVAWLNRHWPSSYPPHHLYTHPHLIEANTGYPTLVALKEGRAEAFLAANMEGTSGSAAANREKKWLRQLGFVVNVTDAGAWLEASPELLKRLSRHVECHRLFATAVAHGARLLRAMDATVASAA